jgi:hypothetical protein
MTMPNLPSAPQTCRGTLVSTALLAGIFSRADRVGPRGRSNWPQWRGPLANGVAPEGNPPTTWSETRT